MFMIAAYLARLMAEMMLPSDLIKQGKQGKLSPPISPFCFGSFGVLHDVIHA